MPYLRPSSILLLILSVLLSVLILSCDPDEAKKKPPNTQNQTNKPKTIKAAKIAKIPKVVSLDAVSSKTAGNDGGTDARTEADTSRTSLGWVFQDKEITFSTSAKDKDDNIIANARFKWEWRKRGKETTTIKFGHTWTEITGQTTASATLSIDAKERVGAYELRVSAISGGEEAKSKTPYRFTVRKYTLSSGKVCPAPSAINKPADLAALKKLTTTLTGNDLNAIDTSKITNMQELFISKDRFNGEINCWDVSNVQDMESVFNNAFAFNQNIGDWDTSEVTTMENMFLFARAFNNGNNPSIGNWDVSKVKNMSSMFEGTRAFNQDIGGWDTSQVINMTYMFNTARVFNQDLSGWDVSKVTDKTRFAGSTPDWTDNNHLPDSSWDNS